MQERDAVVPGERRIGEQRRERGKEITVKRDRGEALPDRHEGDVPQLPIEEPPRNHDRQEPDHGPHELAHILHRRGDRSRRPPFCA
jgi:hypothetical protein